MSGKIIKPGKPGSKLRIVLNAKDIVREFEKSNEATPSANSSSELFANNFQITVGQVCSAYINQKKKQIKKGIQEELRILILREHFRKSIIRKFEVI